MLPSPNRESVLIEPFFLGCLSHAGELDPSKLIVVHCKSAYRSSIATSILRRAGFREIANLTGGYDAWKAAGNYDLQAAFSARAQLTHPLCRL
jgi:rhodanese-related sulfurtransferase